MEYVSFSGKVLTTAFLSGQFLFITHFSIFPQNKISELSLIQMKEPNATLFSFTVWISFPVYLLAIMQKLMAYFSILF